jgi:hypothetical protein
LVLSHAGYWLPESYSDASTDVFRGSAQRIVVEMSVASGSCRLRVAEQLADDR